MIVLALVTLAVVFLRGDAQVPIPTKPVGFVYGNGSRDAPVQIGVFIDLACPDSKMTFPTMLQVADMYPKDKLRMKFLVFPLPYHRNAHFAAIGARAAFNNPPRGMSPDNATVAWAHQLFDVQSKWGDSATMENTLPEIRSLLASYSADIGYNPKVFETFLKNADYDWDARVEWKYGCSRGVAGTPWYFVNDVVFSGEANWPASHWKMVIDNLLNGRTLLN